MFFSRKGCATDYADVYAKNLSGRINRKRNARRIMYDFYPEKEDVCEKGPLSENNVFNIG